QGEPARQLVFSKYDLGRDRSVDVACALQIINAAESQIDDPPVLTVLPVDDVLADPYDDLRRRALDLRLLRAPVGQNLHPHKGRAVKRLQFGRRSKRPRRLAAGRRCEEYKRRE